LSNEQVKKIYKVVSSSGYQCFFIHESVSTSIANKIEFSALNKMEKSIDDILIKEICWKLEVDRLGNITKIIRGLH
jgi:CRISPR-associated endonuclease Csn1